MQTVIDYISNRLREESTWRGLILLVTAAGIQLSPEQQGAILAAGLALVGCINTFKKQPNSKDAK